MDATIADPLVGRLLDGRYRVTSRLAHGGMATVYVAVDARLDRTVALKIMHRELASNPDFVRRFIDEAKSVARLSHPNVVAVFDQGRDGETLYLAMEYVAGRRLRDLLNERGRLAPAEALDLVVPVLAGLGAAHQAGLVHRDVKPENVLINPDGMVKVVDFGLARAVTQARQTATGMLIGTAAYLAPEQVSHATADARSDVYAAGVMLFELLTGRQPYTGDTPLAVAYQHVNETVPAPSQVVAGLPHAVDAVVALATSRDPDLRPGDASQLLGAVFDARRRLPGGTAFAAGSGVPFAPSPAPGLPGQAGLARQGEVAGPGQPWPADRVAPHPPGAPAHTPEAAPQGPGVAPHDPDAGPYGLGAPARGPLPHRPGDPRGDGTDAAVQPDGTARVGPPAPPGPPPPGGFGPEHSVIFGVPGIPGVAALPASGNGGGAGAAGGTGWANGPHPGAAGPVGGTAATGQHNTLVVQAGPGGHGGPAGHRPRRPSLGELLFSRRGAYLAGGTAAVLLVSFLGWWLVAGRYARVPDVTGLAAATAAADLRDAGFKVQTGPPRVDDRVPKGEVSQTRPGTGSRVPDGATITIFMSAGPRMIVVPSVTGESVSDARKALIAAGLTPGVVRQQTSPTVPQGEVISTDPAAGTSWPQTRPVVITQSAGIGLPDFTGQPRQIAEQWLAEHQLQAQEQPVSSTTVPRDGVARQSPAAGSPITPGETVTLYVSTGPALVKVPDVTGKPVRDARQELEARGFKVDVVGGKGTVFAFTPTGQAPKGSTITLFAGLIRGLP